MGVGRATTAAYEKRRRIEISHSLLCKPKHLNWYRDKPE